MFFYSCKSSKTKQINVQQQYFEEFNAKKIISGYYGGYFILDGNKHIYKIYLNTKEEILVESNFEEGQVVYSNADFYKSMVIIFTGNDVFRVIKGDLNIYKHKNNLEVKLNVLGIKDMWELVSDSIPEIEDGNHHNVIFEGKVKRKEL